MTLSSDNRRESLKEALVTLLNALGDGMFATFWNDPNEFSDILLTTWNELADRYWLKDMNLNAPMYRFTPLGYVKAQRISGRANDNQFREDLGKICKVLKDSAKGRTAFAFVDFFELVRESNVSEAFARNAIDADLIRHVLGRVGARWEGDSLVIKVPHNFGLVPL